MPPDGMQRRLRRDLQAWRPAEASVPPERQSPTSSWAPGQGLPLPAPTALGSCTSFSCLVVESGEERKREGMRLSATRGGAGRDGKVMTGKCWASVTAPSFLQTPCSQQPQGLCTGCLLSSSTPPHGSANSYSCTDHSWTSLPLSALETQ